MSIQIIPRSRWNAAPPLWGPYSIPTPTPELWLHHSASSGTDETAVKAIQTYHQLPVSQGGRGWSDIAYSYLMDNDSPDIDIFQGRGFGIAGGHTKGRNSISHAICIIGNYSTKPPNSDTIDKLVEFVAHGYREGWWPNQISGGHRDAPGSSTTCPGDALWSMIPEINARISNLLEGNVGAPLEPYEQEAIDRLIEDGIFTQYTVDEEGEVNANVSIRKLAVFLDRLNTDVENVEKSVNTFIANQEPFDPSKYAKTNHTHGNQYADKTHGHKVEGETT